MKRLLLTGVVLMTAALSGCNRADGDRIARVSARLSDKLEDLVPDRTPFGTPLNSRRKDGMENRVRERFQHDRYLAAEDIEVVAEEGGVRLKGRVADPILKRRAVELAESTVGVERVIDELSVRGIIN